MLIAELKLTIENLFLETKKDIISVVCLFTSYPTSVGALVSLKIRKNRKKELKYCIYFVRKNAQLLIFIRK